MDYSFLSLSDLDFVKSIEGELLYGPDSPYMPDAFTGEILSLILFKYGSISAFCERCDLSRSKLLRFLSKQGLPEMPLLYITCICDELGLDHAAFCHHVIEPSP